MTQTLRFFMVVLAVCLFQVYLFPGTAQASCLEHYKRSSKTEKYSFEIKLFSQIEKVFPQGASASKISEFILTNRDPLSISALNKFAEKYYSKSKRVALAGRPVLKPEEFMISVVLDYYDGKFCPDDAPMSANKILRNYYLFDSRRETALMKHFGKRERDEQVICPAFHAIPYKKRGVGAEEIQGVLKGFECALPVQDQVAILYHGELHVFPRVIFEGSPLLGFSELPGNRDEDQDREGIGYVLDFSNCSNLTREDTDFAVKHLVTVVKENLRLGYSGKDSFVKFAEYLGIERNLFWDEVTGSRVGGSGYFERPLGRLMKKVLSEMAQKQSAGAPLSGDPTLALLWERVLGVGGSIGNDSSRNSIILFGLALENRLPVDLVSEDYRSKLKDLVGNFKLDYWLPPHTQNRGQTALFEPLLAKQGGYYPAAFARLRAELERLDRLSQLWEKPVEEGADEARSKKAAKSAKKSSLGWGSDSFSWSE